MQRGVPSASIRHLMLDPSNCILCGVCEQACPWDCIHMLLAGTPGGCAGLRQAEASAGDAYAVFAIDDDVCPRCSLCVDRCPTGALYYARLPEDTVGTRTMTAVPTSQRVGVG